MKKSSQEKGEARSEEADSRLVQIQEECLQSLKQVTDSSLRTCYSSLLQVVLATAQSYQEDRVISGVHEVIPLQCLTEISTNLPITKAALSSVEHMTTHRMNHYQEVILDVTKEFHKQKLDHLASQILAKQAEEDDDDFVGSSRSESSDGWLSRNKKGGAGKNWSESKSRYFNRKTGGGGQTRKDSTKPVGNRASSSTGSMGLPKPKC